MPALRRPLAAALAAGCLSSGVVLAPGPTASAAPSAPGCGSGTTQAHTRAAQAVFSGTVAEVTRQGTGARVRYTHEVDVDLVWKGGLSSETTEVVTAGGRRPSCELGRLDPGTEVMFFVSRGDGAWVAAGDSGTAPAEAALVTRITRLLGHGVAPVAPAPETATFQRVADSEPATLSRTAAPGLALVIVGLLGLVVVRHLGRR